MQPSYSASSTTPFRIIGHAGMRTTSDGSLIIKPAFPAEHQFYETLNQGPHLARLRPFIPKFLGTLSENQGEGPAHVGGIPIPPGRTQSLVLENLCNAFIKPNTLDVKLGTVFHDEFMASDKVLRMERTARETTSLRTGVRLTEFQGSTRNSKSYGKALKVSELPEGISQFFPVSCESSRHTGSVTGGLPRKYLMPILRGIRETVLKIREVYSSFELRMVGGSLLIMYEADWNRAEAGVRQLAQIPARGEDRGVHGRPPYVVKLVDFAHTRLAPGEGPDEGVLLGLDTMLKLLDGRIAQLAGTSEP